MEAYQTETDEKTYRIPSHRMAAGVELGDGAKVKREEYWCRSIESSQGRHGECK